MRWPDLRLLPAVLLASLPGAAAARCGQAAGGREGWPECSCLHLPPQDRRSSCKANYGEGKERLSRKAAECAVGTRMSKLSYIVILERKKILFKEEQLTKKGVRIFDGGKKASVA